MARRLIRLVRNDDLPSIVVQISNQDTGEVVDLSPASTVVSFKFRAQGSETTLFEIAALTKISGGNLGVVRIDFPANSLDGLVSGRYQGEITVTFAGSDQTVIDLVKFKLKADFADA